MTETSPVAVRRLSVVVFVAGAATLATEIAASRLLAPYFGSSTIVWANIIGLILIYLSLGYWLGGKLADRRPEPRVLGLIVGIAAVFVALTPFVARPVLDVGLDALDSVEVGAAVGSFFGALLLFAVPVTLLGMVSPFAIRLALVDIKEAGAVAGRLYALSTVGVDRRDVPLGHHPHPADRDAADDARRRGASSAWPRRSSSGGAGRSSPSCWPRSSSSRPGRSRRARA